jgi:CubicO group peptidase (beta-lactamase class C family)
MKVILVLSIAFCILKITACSENPPAMVEPTLAGQLQTVLDARREEHAVKGISVAVKIPDQETLLLTSGLSEDSIPITSAMIFNMASVTKTFVATLVLLLMEEGVLTLDDSLKTWIPDFPNIDNTITIRQLLNHTSGVYDFTWHPDHFDYIIIPEMRKTWTPEEILSSFVLEPNFPPGTGQSYSNTNYIILGMIINATTGSEVSVELSNRILNPLGLNNTFLPAEEAITGTLATPWEDFDHDGICEDCTVYQTVFWSFLWTSGALYSTAEDLVRFADGLFGGDLIRPASLNEMLSDLPRYGYGLGVCKYSSTLFQGNEAIGHDGGGIGYVARISFSMMTNDLFHRDYLDDISESLVRVVFEHPS